MTVLVENLSSDGEACMQLRKTPEIRYTDCPTGRAPERRHTASPTCEGDGSKLVDEDYLHLLDMQSTSDSDVYCIKEDKGVNPVDGGVTDPHYKIFLEILKLRDDFKKETLQRVCLSQKTGNGRYNADTFVKQSNRRKKSESDSMWRNIEVKQSKGVLQGKNTEVEEITTPAKTKRCSAQKFDESVHPHDMHDSAEDYVAWNGNILAFVQPLRKDGDFFVRTFGSGKTMRYGEYEEEDGLPDVEIINRENFSSTGLNNPFVSAHSTDAVNIESMEGDKIPSCNNSEFRINLLKKFKEPYDMKEPEDLMKMVTHKRCKEVNKEQRGGRGVSYSAKDIYKSYIDIYKDFAKILKRVRGNQHRTLNLLKDSNTGCIMYPREDPFILGWTHSVRVCCLDLRQEFFLSLGLGSRTTLGPI